MKSTILHISHGSISHIFELLGILVAATVIYFVVSNWKTVKAYFKSKRKQSGKY